MADKSQGLSGMLSINGHAKAIMRLLDTDNRQVCTTPTITTFWLRRLILNVIKRHRLELPSRKTYLSAMRGVNLANMVRAKDEPGRAGLALQALINLYNINIT